MDINWSDPNVWAGWNIPNNKYVPPPVQKVVPQPLPPVQRGVFQVQGPTGLVNTLNGIRSQGNTLQAGMQLLQDPATLTIGREQIAADNTNAALRVLQGLSAKLRGMAVNQNMMNLRKSVVVEVDKLAARISSAYDQQSQRTLINAMAKAQKDKDDAVKREMKMAGITINATHM